MALEVKVERVTWTNLQVIDPDQWLRAVLKGTDTEVELVVLHHDASTGAASSLVRFPAGLTRNELGCYPAAEELAIIEGSLDFAGRTFEAGDYAYVPPFVLRTPMTSPDGLLVFAWFSGAPAWLTDESSRVEGDVLHARLEPGVLRNASSDVPGTTEVVTILEPSPVDREVLDLATAQWCFLPAGTTPPRGDGPFLTRTWVPSLSE